jgi:hypothetical protein
MPANNTTQILNVRWQERSWQPRIQRATGRRAARPANGGSSRLAASVTTAQTVRLNPSADADRPCRQQPVSLVKRVFLAFRPRRTK